jgi:hypothetical protein
MRRIPVSFDRKTEGESLGAPIRRIKTLNLDAASPGRLDFSRNT